MSTYLDPYLDGDTIMIPKRAEGPDGAIGVGWTRLTTRDPQYQQWIDYMTAKGLPTPAGAKRAGRTPGGSRGAR